MARFISVNNTASGLANGEWLFNVDQILYVEAASATTTILYLNNDVAAEDVVTLTHTSVGTTPSVKRAIQNAMTANPGGVKAKVQLPTGITVSGIAIT